MTLAVDPHPLLCREPWTYHVADFAGRRVAVTGGAGSLGSSLIGGGMPKAGGVWSSLDLPQAYDAIGTDVLDYRSLKAALKGAKSDTVIHTAANKHAPEAEDYPAAVADLNVRGTDNVVRACQELGIERLVFVSTCKAAQPETVYGASKLIGERIVLNAGYTVARLYNVVESSRNVFRIWEQAGAEIGVAQCSRFFITLEEAVSFILSCVDREPGRYCPDANRHNMINIAARWAKQHPGVTVRAIPPRRGDRQVEPRWGDHERGTATDDGAWKVVSAHD